MNMSKLRASLEDTIMLKGAPATAGSKILHNFIAPLDATVVKKLRGAGVELSVHTASDEFGAGGFWDNTEKMSAAVAAVAEGRADFALCNDISGSARRQAPENGLCFVQPAYGVVSRFGLVAAVSSMDRIGIVSKNPKDGFDMLSVIAGHDENDGTTYKNYDSPIKTSAVKAIYLTEALTAAIPADRDAVRTFGQKLGATEESFKYFDIMPQVLYILSCAELSNNITRYDGIKFGYRPENFRGLNDLYLKSRTEGFGPDAKLASIMGCMVLSHEYYEQWYDKAMRLRRLIKETAERLLDTADILILPCHIEGDMYRQSALHALEGLAGLPSVSIPHGGACLRLLTKPGNESVLLTACEGAYMEAKV